EYGNISANRPRILPPLDSITPWWSAAANKITVANPYISTGTNTPALNPRLSGGPANQQQPIWFIDGNTNQLYQIYGGFVNTGALNASGVAQGASTNLIGQAFS